MKFGRIGSIHNVGGVVNLGEIYGDVTTSIDRSFGSNQDALKQALLELTAELNEHAGELPAAGEAMERVRKISEEASAAEPDGVVLGRHLDLIAKAVGVVPNLLDCVARVRGLLAGILG